MTPRSGSRVTWGHSAGEAVGGEAGPVLFLLLQRWTETLGSSPGPQQRGQQLRASFNPTRPVASSGQALEVAGA